MKNEAAQGESSLNLIASGAEHMTPLLPHPNTPAAIPDHELLKRIGSGSYGDVWLARTVLGQYRAVKIVRRQSFDHDKPYDREFAGIQKFEPISRAHEGHVDILHVGRNDAAGYFYYVMELADPGENPKPECQNPKETRNPNVEGQNASETTRASSFGLPSSFDIRHSDLYVPRTLKHDLRTRGSLPVHECVQIALSLTHALEHLHGHGLVHRDIKPSNIIFVKGAPKLADIGLVTSVDATRSFVGTDGYIPPEGPGTPAGDLYSLGKVLYECVTGKDRLDFPELPADWRSRPDFDQLLEFNEILTKACDNDPRQRYSSAQAMAAELALVQRGQSLKAQRERAARWAIAKKGAIALTLLTVLVTGASILLREFKRSRSGRESNLSIELGRLDEGKISTNSEANVLYHRAMGIMRGDDYQKLGEAYTNFTEATRLDPNFAKAYAALFEMHIRERFVGKPSNQQDLLRKLSAKLVELAPSLSATHVARACVQYMDWQFDEAKKSWEKAILLNLNNEFAHTSYGYALTRWGDSTNALKQLRMAADLEPSKGVIQQILGMPYYLKRDYTNAIAQSRKGLRFRPNDLYAHYDIGRALQAMHRYLEAIDEFEKVALIDEGDEAKTKESFDRLRDVFKKNGEKGYWEEQLRRTETKPDSEFYWKAVIHVHLGHTNDVFHWLNTSFQTRENMGNNIHNELNDLLFDEYWDPLRGDRHFKELVRKMSFPGK